MELSLLELILAMLKKCFHLNFDEIPSRYRARQVRGAFILQWNSLRISKSEYTLNLKWKKSPTRVTTTKALEAVEVKSLNCKKRENKFGNVASQVLET